MDALFSTSPVQFRQLVAHIALAHDDCSPGFRALAESCLRSVGVRRAHTYVYWNVPQLHTLLPRPVPLDVHGRHVLLDEAAVTAAAGSYGVLRFALLAAAQRAREGGRWRYDFTSMNVALGVGVVCGGATLSYGRRRVAWLRRRPVGSVAFAFVVCVCTVVALRRVVRGVGVGTLHAQQSHRAAMAALRCVDCLDDVVAYNARQQEELRAQHDTLLAMVNKNNNSNDDNNNNNNSTSHLAMPGMPLAGANAAAPPMPAEYVQRVQRSIEAQQMLLELDNREARAAARRCGGEVLCEVHGGLRDAPATYTAPHGLPLLPSDRERAAQRRRAHIAAAGDTAASTRSDDDKNKDA